MPVLYTYPGQDGQSKLTADGVNVHLGVDPSMNSNAYNDTWFGPHGIDSLVGRVPHSTNPIDACEIHTPTFCPLPVGLSLTPRFLSILSNLSGESVISVINATFRHLKRV